MNKAGTQKIETQRLIKMNIAEKTIDKTEHIFYIMGVFVIPKIQ